MSLPIRSQVKDWMDLRHTLQQINIELKALLGGGSGGVASTIEHGDLTGLADQDHPQYFHEVYVPLLAVATPVTI